MIFTTFAKELKGDMNMEDFCLWIYEDKILLLLLTVFCILSIYSLIKCILSVLLSINNSEIPFLIFILILTSLYCLYKQSY